jgi:hypothetical protein
VSRKPKKIQKYKKTARKKQGKSLRNLPLTQYVTLVNFSVRDTRHERRHTKKKESAKTKSMRKRRARGLRAQARLFLMLFVFAISYFFCVPARLEVCGRRRAQAEQ